MSAISHAIILAAGRGNRMRPLTDILPKALAPYGESTLIGSRLASLGEQVQHIHVTVGYKGGLLAPYLLQHGVNTIVNTEGRTNSWWIHHSLLRHLDAPLLVLTCDNITDLDVGLIAAEYDRVGRPACMIVPVAPLAGIEGDFVAERANRVTHIGRDISTNLYCSGIQVLNPARVCSITPSTGDFYAIWRALIEASELGVASIYPKPWFSVDTLEQLATIQQMPVAAAR